MGKKLILAVLLLVGLLHSAPAQAEIRTGSMDVAPVATPADANRIQHIDAAFNTDTGMLSMTLKLNPAQEWPSTSFYLEGAPLAYVTVRSSGSASTAVRTFYMSAATGSETMMSPQYVSSLSTPGDPNNYRPSGSVQLTPGLQVGCDLIFLGRTLHLTPCNHGNQVVQPVPQPPVGTTPVNTAVVVQQQPAAAPQPSTPPVVGSQFRSTLDNCCYSYNTRHDAYFKNWNRWSDTTRGRRMVWWITNIAKPWTKRAAKLVAPPGDAAAFARYLAAADRQDAYQLRMGQSLRNHYIHSASYYSTKSEQAHNKLVDAAIDLGLNRCGQG